MPVRSALLAAAAALLLASPAPAAETSYQTMSFSEDVQPILAGRCVSCHQPGGPGYERTGLDLRTHAGLLKGTSFGPIVIPGDDASSNLVLILDGRANTQIKMPHGSKKRLSTCDRDAIRLWIRQGAKDD